MTHRLHYIDNLKGVLILLVVLGHCIQCTDLDFDHNAVFRYIYSFHMPFFIYLAGLFHSNHNIKNRCVSFIAIGFSMKILFALCRMIFFHKASFSLLSDSGVAAYILTRRCF